MSQMCGFCSGSGRDPVTGSGTCMMCGGSGVDYSASPPPVSGGRRASSPPPVSGGRRASGGEGRGGEFLLGIVGLLLAFVVGAGYVVASEMLTHHFLGTHYTDHSWTNTLVYLGVSIALIILVARLWGFLPGLAAGLIPGLPLYHATKGGVGFWFIAMNGGEDPTGNVFASWVALTGMIVAHAMIAWSAQPRALTFRERIFRFRQPTSPLGIAASVAAAILACVFYVAVSQAIAAF